ncbi:DUF4142 domain-containing protein [Dactylosporangium sucinum]|uniref:DUF4142 domain-containing protein n=1 Tax=Dactylosporangium sucinum TaxID=1424081 RepID=A0A917U6Z3_9ACTN|nr:DUF4142 domain-containing protein [Dactylosporangium sucinum]GGM63478.1 hypothetical protein GCM10007977_076370 [Dactylosporangium sucinum]
MKHLHLATAVASLVAAAAWAIPLARPALTAADDLSTADRDLLVQVRLLGLLTHPAGLTARDRAAGEQIRRTGETLAIEHANLDSLTRATAVQVGVPLPATATAEDRDFLRELAATPADRFDEMLVGRLRAAYERAFPMIAAARASTRNTAVRAFATTADAYVARHLDYLDSTGLASRPAAATADAADQAFLARLSQAVLWQQLAGILAQQRATRADIRQAGDLITDEARELNRTVRSAVERLHLPPPDRPSAEQQQALTDLEAARGADFDRAFVNQLRAADGALLFAGAQTRTGTRNTVIRELAAAASSTVLRHMAYLEASGLVRYDELPAPPHAAGLTTTGLHRDDGIHPAVIWLMLAVTVVVAALTGTGLTGDGSAGRRPVRGRPVDTTHRASTRSPSREVIRHELPNTHQTPMVLERTSTSGERQPGRIRPSAQLPGNPGTW